MLKLGGVGSIILAGIFFTIIHLIVKYLNYLPPFQLAFIRSFGTAIAAGLVLLYLKINPFKSQNKLLMLRSLFGCAGLVTYWYTLQNLPLGVAIVLHYLAPIFTIALSSIFLKERTGLEQWKYYLLAFIGVALVKNVNGNIDMLVFLIGILASLFAAAAYTTIRALNNRADTMSIVFYFPFISTFLLAPINYTQWVSIKESDYVIVTSICILSLLAQIFLTRAYKMAQASNIAHFNYLGILYALILGKLLFDETPSILTILGAIIIVFCILKLQYIQKRLKLTHSPS